MLLAGLGDPLLETSKLFIAEPSRGGRPERSQGAARELQQHLSSYRIYRNPRRLWGRPCVLFWVKGL